MDRGKAPALGCLGFFTALAAGVLCSLFVWLGLMNGSHPYLGTGGALAVQGVTLAALFAAAIYGLRLSQENRSFFLGGLIGLGIIGLLWGICAAAGFR